RCGVVVVGADRAVVADIAAAVITDACHPCVHHHGRRRRCSPGSDRSPPTPPHRHPYYELGRTHAAAVPALAAVAGAADTSFPFARRPHHRADAATGLPLAIAPSARDFISEPPLVFAATADTDRAAAPEPGESANAVAAAGSADPGNYDDFDNWLRADAAAAAAAAAAQRSAAEDDRPPPYGRTIVIAVADT
ncbi:hypothetical protein HK405_001560, partial [Cladochytrium tenue]